MGIEQIELRSVLPDVFVGREKGVSQTGSEIWNSNVIIRRGERVLINAGSGRGKSSLLSYLYGRRNDYQGVIFFGGRDIRMLGLADWCAMRQTALSLLPQELGVFPELTAFENVVIKNRLTDCRSEEWILKAFELLGVRFCADSEMGKMSIGQQQRVALVRALCQPFDFLLLDEPVSHLDDVNNDLVASIVKSVIEESGAGVLVTSVGKALNMDYDREFKL